MKETQQQRLLKFFKAIMKYNELRFGWAIYKEYDEKYKISEYVFTSISYPDVPTIHLYLDAKGNVLTPESMRELENETKSKKGKKKGMGRIQKVHIPKRRR